MGAAISHWELPLGNSYWWTVGYTVSWRLTLLNYWRKMSLMAEHGTHVSPQYPPDHAQSLRNPKLCKQRLLTTWTPWGTARGGSGRAGAWCDRPRCMPQFLSSELDLGLMRDTVIRLSPTEKRYPSARLNWEMKSMSRSHSNRPNHEGCVVTMGLDIQ